MVASTATAKTESPSSTLERESSSGGHTIRERTQSLTEQMVSGLQEYFSVTFSTLTFECLITECSIRVFSL